MLSQVFNHDRSRKRKKQVQSGIGQPEEKLAVIYARVSSNYQAKDDKVSIGYQLRICREYAERMGFTVVAEFKEEFTGKVLRRPELDQVMTLFDNRRANVLLCLQQDRLHRKSSVFHILFSQLRRMKVQLYFTDSGLVDANNFESVLRNSLEALMSEEDRTRLVKRMLDAKIARIKAGIPVVVNAAYGYKKVSRGKVIIDEEVVQIVTLIFTWAAEGKEGEGVPLTPLQIAHELNAMGISSAKGKAWRRTVVRDLLVDPIYGGVVAWGKVTYDDGKWNSQPRESWDLMEAPWLAIVDYETWNQAYANITQRYCPPAGNMKKSESLLGRRVFCRECGQRTILFYNTRPTGEKRYIYRCANKACSSYSKGIWVDQADVAVYHWMDHLLMNPELLDAGVRSISERVQRVVRPLESQRDAAIEHIQGLNQRMRNLVTNMQTVTDPELNALVRSQLSTLKEEKGKMRTALIELEEQISKETAGMDVVESLHDLKKEMVRKRFDDMTREDFQALMEALDLNVYLMFHGNPRWAELRSPALEDTLWFQMHRLPSVRVTDPGEYVSGPYKRE